MVRQWKRYESKLQGSGNRSLANSKLFSSSSGLGGYGSDLVTDEAEMQQHHKLERLYISTRAAKHFQRDIVRGVEGYIVTGSKQVEIGTKLSEDSRKYGAENTCTSGTTLSKAALGFHVLVLRWRRSEGIY